ncbi:cytochrome b [Halomonas sp. HL-93]|uniref:cytochrome b n=1 Tax=Halomonas sp. HL-93 TaxID=1666906 RepID=UPI0007F13458|nr:cytochrome b/b6 domain-containing protein [Halomonas sp. HL-93]SBR46985.1 cytochrome b561 [Halomonas sp. HL-93]
MGKGAANSTALNSDHLSKPAQTSIGWRDSPRHYGRISRALHWLTAALVTLQFTVLLAWRGMGENAITLLLASIGPHGSLGFMLLIVTLVRLGWAWVNRKQRPPHPPGLGGRLARLVHITFYALLLMPQVAGHQQSRLGGAGDRLPQSGPFLLPFGPRAPSSSSGISPRAFDCPRSRLHRNQSQWRAEP